MRELLLGGKGRLLGADDIDEDGPLAAFVRTEPGWATGISREINESPRRAVMLCSSGKMTYMTAEEAEAAVQRHKGAQGFSMLEARPAWSSYRCTSCGGWHLTSWPGWPPGFGRRIGKPAAGRCEETRAPGSEAEAAPVAPREDEKASGDSQAQEGEPTGRVGRVGRVYHTKKGVEDALRRIAERRFTRRGGPTWS